MYICICMGGGCYCKFANYTFKNNIGARQEKHRSSPLWQGIVQTFKGWSKK